MFFFLLSYRGQVWTETPTGGAVNFITGAGGFLQSVLFGYGGLRLTSNALTWAPPPQPPQNASAIVLHGVHYAGASLRLTAGVGVLQAQLLASGPSLLCLRQGSKTTALSLGETVQAPGNEPAAIALC